MSYSGPAISLIQKTSMMKIEVRELTKHFGTVKALDRVDLTVEPGELFFLLGASGCGKTTLLRSLAGFYIPEQGTIFFGDQEVTRLAPHKRQTGMVFQNYALWPHMTVAQNVAFGLEQQKLDRAERSKRVEEALAAVKMQAYAARKPHELSGGQQQRVALARALVVRPRCLLLDEPLSNLDARLRLEMRAEIRRVCKEYGLTTIYVTHDQKEALSVADRMAVMDQGRILQIGTPREVYRRPVNAHIASFVGETNFIPGKLLRSEGSTALVETALGVLEGVLSDPDHQPEEGDEVQVSIRPECLHMENYPVEENGFEGEIMNSVYYGEIAQYGIKCADIELKVYELNPHFVAEDREVYLWVHAEDVVVLR